MQQMCSLSADECLEPRLYQLEVDDPAAAAVAYQQRGRRAPSTASACRATWTG